MNAGSLPSLIVASPKFAEEMHRLVASGEYPVIAMLL